MIELSKHIEILLLDNDCVIVPNLGGFLAHHVDAQYDVRDHAYLPPRRTIGFNPQLKLNDHLLVQSYIEAYDISYPEALRRIENAVEELKQHLENEGEHELNNLGILSINADGHYQFTPFEAGLLSPSLYGLAHFNMLPLNELGKQEENGTDVVALSAEDSMKDNEESVAPGDSEAIVIRMSWLRNVAVVAAAIIMVFFISSPVDNDTLVSDVQQSTILPINNVSIHEKSKDTISEAIEEIVAEPVDSLASDSITNETEPASNYTIVIASKTSLVHADNFVNEMVVSGYDEAFLQKMDNSSLYRVVFGSYDTEDEAIDALRALRVENQSVFKDAWVLQNK